MRLSKEQLEKIKEENNTDRIWSWSRMNTYLTSPYEYKLKYIDNMAEDRVDCIYGSMGGLCHDVLDKYYEQEIPYEKMILEFEDGYGIYRDVFNLKFDRNTPDKDENLAKRYYDNLHHFYLHHIPYTNNLIIEDPVTIKIGDNVFVGYIDAMYQDGEDWYILDFKSSSIYTGATLTEHSGQLVLYAIGISQTKEVPLDKIHIGFNFLKYTTIEYEMANGSIKKMNVERRLLGEKLQSSCKMWLKKFGYEPEEYLKDIFDNPDNFNKLPLEVQDKIKIKDCHVFIDLTPELVDYWENLIIDTLNEIEVKETEFYITNDESIFYDTPEQVEKESYYMATLCGFSANLHKPYKKYLDNLEKPIDIFS